MADHKPTNREKVKEIVASIEGGIKALFQSEQYAEYLRTMSRFHNYSYRNTLLIHMQRPDATLVAGFSKWKNQFQRHVKKGEKGMTILAPTPFKKKIEEMKLDPDTKSPLRDDDGNIITEEKIVEIPMFRPVKVFDVKQTEGKPIPSLSMDLTGNVQHYEAFMEALRRTSPVPVEIKPIQDSMDGYFSPAKQRIAVRDDMSEVQTVCAVLHEITHATLHNRQREQDAASAGMEGVVVKRRDEQKEEVEAESVSYAVCQYYGIETSANSLAYIATWSSDKELPELKSSLETISRTANFLITTIDRHFAEICKERGIVLEQAEQDAPVSESDKTADKEPPDKGDEYLYSSEYNPEHVGKGDFRRIRARKLSDPDMKPEQIIFVGSADMCDKLLEHLSRGTLTRDDFVTVNSACVSRYTTKDGKELDVFVTPEDKVYMGLRNHYDNRGHYYNPDKSMLYVSDNDKMFRFLSGSGYTETQSEMLEEGYFTQEDYAEYAALQADVLAQFQETAPLMFADEPFCFIPPDASEVKRDAAAVAEPQEALYLVDNRAYLHIQSCDAGYDYTLYDKSTMHQLNSGQIDPLNVDTHFSQSVLRSVADAALISTPGLDGDTVESVPLEMLETLREAAARDMQEAADTTLDEYPLPDPQMPKSGLLAYGYEEDDLIPVGPDVAKALYERDFSLYIAGNSGYFNMVFEPEELDAPGICLYAIPRGEWAGSPDFQRAVADRMNHQEEREKAFLDHAGDCFAIYQLRRDDSTRDLRYEPLERLRLAGESPRKGNYELAYTGKITSGQDLSVLDKLYEQFNANHPADYQRPSMSISDIVALKQDGVVSCYYVDQLAFTAMPGFFQKEPTVAELEAQVKAGQSISLMDLAAAAQREKKKSVVAKLKSQPAQGRKKTSPKKNLKKER